MIYEPRPYQVAGIAKLTKALEQRGAALDMSDMGTGKTWKALFVANHFQRPVAVVCPAVTKTQWRDAARKIGVPVILCESYEKVTRGTAEGITKTGSKRPRFKFSVPRGTIFVFDEVHKCRAYKTLNSQLLMDCADHRYQILMLSATPFEDTRQFRAIGHALKIIHKNKWWNWCLSVGGCCPGRFGGLDYVGGEKVLTDLRRQFDWLMDRTRIEDVGDLPEFKMQTRLISAKSLKAINKAYTELLEVFQEETEHAIVQRLRGRQIIEHNKIRQLYELACEFEENSEKVLHFVNFTDTVDQLKQLHGDSYGIIDGRVTGAARQEVVDRFQRGELAGLIIQLQSGGVGLNLQDLDGDKPRTAILNLTDSATLFRQATGRIFRDGSKSKCRFVVPLVEGTVEEQMDLNLQRKFKNLEALCDADLLP